MGTQQRKIGLKQHCSAEQTPDCTVPSPISETLSIIRPPTDPASSPSSSIVCSPQSSLIGQRYSMPTSFLGRDSMFHILGISAAILASPSQLHAVMQHAAMASEGLPARNLCLCYISWSLWLSGILEQDSINCYIKHAFWDLEICLFFF